MVIPNIRSFDLTHGQLNIGYFELESGSILKGVQVAYERLGSSNAPAVLNIHALTGNQYAYGDGNGWWAGMIGPGLPLDTNKYQVITFNALGGCHGTTGPSDACPEKGEAYGADFPFFTIRDMVRLQYRALQQLGISTLHAVIGGSLGGMQVLEFGILYPDFINKLVCLAATPLLSDYGIAFNAIARKTITNDPEWKNGCYNQGDELMGLQLARMIGMITYRTPQLFDQRFGRNRQENWGESHDEDTFKVESYLTHQGEKLSKRFDPNSYLYLLKAMDSHDIGRHRGGWQKAISQIKVPVLALGYQDDLIYPPQSMEEMISCHQDTQPVSEFRLVSTLYGHDGFLVEFDNWGSYIKNWLAGN